MNTQNIAVQHGDMLQSARLGKLRYIQDSESGFSRKPNRGKFSYLDESGKPLKATEHLSRIKALKIPPAWNNVWICRNPQGHLQATGRDAKERKQYIYHAQWRKVRDAVKYEHMVDFGLHLPVIRKQVEIDLARSGLVREKVIATIIYLLENTMMRIGNDEYAKTNKSFGLTTLRNRHVDIHGSEVRFHFRGKSGVEHEISLDDKRLARIICAIKELPGQALFQFLDDQGQRHTISSSDVNDYLHQITGRDYTAKDFRTWSGTLHTMLELSLLQPYETKAEAKKNIVMAICAAAKKLGNTPAICRKSYVHPLILDSYMAGELFSKLKHKQDNTKHILETVEYFMLDLLQKIQR